jgi:hypothetical protein
MKSGISASKRLESTLDAIEKMIVDASDAEILESSSDPIGESNQVRTLFANEVKKANELKKIVSASAISVSRTTPGFGLSNRVPNKFNDRLVYLKNLVRTQPNISPRMVSVFSSNRNPSEREVDELIAELIRLGIIDKANQ